mgnify:CR=1 FL=1
MENRIDLGEFDGLDKCNFTVEEHGQGYALYNDRGPNRHGYNLCLLTEFDQSGPKIRAAIEAIPDLIAEVRELRRENEELQSRLGNARQLLKNLNPDQRPGEYFAHYCDLAAMLEGKQ